MKKSLYLGAVLGSVCALLPMIAFAAIVTCDGNQTQIVNGQTVPAPCTIDDVLRSLKAVYLVIAGLVFTWSLFMLAYFGVTNYPYDRPEALKELWKRAFNTIIWGAVLFAVIPLFYAILKSFGVGGEYLDIIKKLNVDIPFVQHAYAQTQIGLPQPIKFEHPYDLLLLILGVLYQWVIIPALIGMWVYSGFLFVFAQGAPVQLTKARKTLWYSVILTVILLVLQTVIFALRATITGITQ